MTIQISGKIELKLKIVTRDKKDIIMTRRSIHQEDTTIINIYAPNYRVSKNVRQKLIIKGKNRKLKSNSWRLQYLTLKNG